MRLQTLHSLTVPWFFLHQSSLVLPTSQFPSSFYITVQIYHRLWSIQKQTFLTFRCNTVMWTIREMMILMTVAACHLKDNNVLDNSVYKNSAAQLLNSVYTEYCAFPPYFITRVCCFSKKQQLLLLIV